tara:strand:+ start:72 stop:743 length:672 start_codon:yes stop_codon:yes gene_type:complete
MKNIIYILLICSLLLTSCKSASVIKSKQYSSIYNQNPLSVLIMPPINRSTNVEAKEFFYTTLNVPVINAGYYVIPPFLSMEILKRESAYDAELFIDRPSLEVFDEIFGADIAMFTIINKWDKSSVFSTVTIDLEYILKSTRTNEVLFTKKGVVTYNTSLSTGNPLLNIAASLINTAAIKYVDVARACNNYSFSDIPKGKYSPKFGLDREEKSSPKKFNVRLPK